MKLTLALCATLMFSATVLAQQQDSPVPSAPPTQPFQAAGASQSSSAPDSARLCVYRARRYAGSALAPSIYLDDKQVARVGNGRRVAIRLTLASHTIRSDDKSSSISLDVKTGQDYFVRIEEEPGFWKGHGKLTLVLPEQGVAEYKLQKPIEQDRKITKELIVDDSEEAPACGKK